VTCLAAKRRDGWSSPGPTNRSVSYPEDHDLSGRVRKAAREQTDKVLERLGGSTPPEVAVDAVSGSPAEELLRVAEGALLLVVGSRGAGGSPGL
jgi:nucleotide-binding universal stress UspA family protein